GPLTKLGVNPWVAHFFVFLISVWGELSPPTSLTAAISARIAEASFMRTMWVALKICLPITLMTFAIFTRTDIVVNPGWAQIGATLLVTIGTCATAFAMFGRFVENPVGDILLRAALGLFAFVTMFHPDGNVATVSAVVALLATIYGIIRHRQIAPPKSGLQSQPV
ncbi:MAG: TRAP transporter large permease subunit, partial [Betaproteobacteria bacterium]|nr:TRAP transporter large permease subunit [Betaproteobacteria bacterium]